MLTIWVLLHRFIAAVIRYGMIPHTTVLVFRFVTLLPLELLTFEYGLKYVLPFPPRGLVATSRS